MYFRAVICTIVSAGALLADFKYDQNTRMTGGSMLRMMKLFSRGATDNMTSTIAVKGDKMVTRTKDTANIIDLGAETITDVNFKNQTYTVVTFAQMKEQLEKMAAGAKSKEPAKSQGDPNVSMKVDVKETGKTATLSGVPASEWMMTMVFEGTEADGGKGQLSMEMSNWVSKGQIPGYQEVVDFHKRMAEKIGLMTGSLLRAPAGQPGVSKGIAEMAKKMADMGGFPVVSIMRTVPGDPEQIKQMQEAQRSQENEPPPPTASEAAAQSVAGQLGRIGGLGGKLGGFGRKKKDPVEEPASAAAPSPKPAPAPAAASSAPVAGSFSSSFSLIEMTTEASNFSNAPVDDSLLSVPAGFKQVTKR